FTSGGLHKLRVSFSGDSNVNGSYNDYAMNIDRSTFSYANLTSDVTSAAVGAPIKFTAQIGSDVRNYIATGTVTFLDGTTTIGSATLDATGTATLAVSTLAPGVHSIYANYSGDAALQPSSAGPLSASVADYSVQAQPSTLDVGRGGSASTTLSILPI